MKKLNMTCLDLFSGCGGFSLGMLRAGFQVVAAIDNNPEALETLRANLAERAHPRHPPVRHVLLRDITRLDPAEVAETVGAGRVDVIVGGPPCQGFSTARQVNGANHGPRLKQDARRLLFRDYLRFVAHFEPYVFVIENVLGIRSAAGGQYFTQVQQEARGTGRHGYRVHSQVEDALELGVPQKRRRQLIIGVRSDLPGFFPSRLEASPHARPGIALGPAIGDLPKLAAGGGRHVQDYSETLRRNHLERYGEVARSYLQDVLEVGMAANLTNHVARPHSARDLRDFARLREGENSATAMRDRGETAASCF